MNTIYSALIFFLLANTILGLVRVSKGPSTADRMIAAYLTGTVGAAIILILSQTTGNQHLKDISLLFVLLGAMALIAFVNRIWTDRENISK